MTWQNKLKLSRKNTNGCLIQQQEQQQQQQQQKFVILFYYYQLSINVIIRFLYCYRIL